MKATEFAYWLQGAFEINDTKTFDVNQINIIKRHLKLSLHYEELITSGKIVNPFAIPNSNLTRPEGYRC